MVFRSYVPLVLLVLASLSGCEITQEPKQISNSQLREQTKLLKSIQETLTQIHAAQRETLLIQQAQYAQQLSQWQQDAQFQEKALAYLRIAGPQAAQGASK